jgi:hypothetical protein
VKLIAAAKIKVRATVSRIGRERTGIGVELVPAKLAAFHVALHVAAESKSSVNAGNTAVGLG